MNKYSDEQDELNEEKFDKLEMRSTQNDRPSDEKKLVNERLIDALSAKKRWVYTANRIKIQLFVTSQMKGNSKLSIYK
jgi:hypothetical protein